MKEVYLCKFALDKFGMPKPLSCVYWFHLTRTLDGNLFTNGIKPLGEALDDIWKILITKSPSEEVKNNLLKLKSQNDNYLYNLKISDSGHWGPYAILVREVAFNAESLHQHDYLKMPEIIEDVCFEYEQIYEKNIFDYYNSILTPKIIKFRSNKQLDDGCIKAALFYAYRQIHNQAISGGAVTCFDGEGKAIPAEDILSVKRINSTTPSTPAANAAQLSITV